MITDIKSMAGSISPNESMHDVEVKHTRSGRVVIPPLAGWSGERIVSSLKDGVPPTYVSPSLDKRAHYLLSSSMRERLQKQKFFQNPLQVGEKSFAAVSSSKENSAKCRSSKQKHKRMGTQHRRKPLTSKRGKVDVSYSESNITGTKLHQNPQRKNRKDTVHHFASCESGSSCIESEIKKTPKPLVTNKSVNRRNFTKNDPHSGSFEVVDKGTNYFCEVDKKVCHENSTENALENKHQKLKWKTVSPEHKDKSNCIVDESQSNSQLESYPCAAEISGPYQKQNHVIKNSKNKLKCPSNKKQERNKIKKRNKKRGKSSMNICNTAISESHLNNDLTKKTENTALVPHKMELTLGSAVVSDQQTANSVHINHDLPNKKKAELHKSTSFNAQHSFDANESSKDNQDFSLEKTFKKRASSMSKKTAEANNIFLQGNINKRAVRQKKTLNKDVPESKEHKSEKLERSSDFNCGAGTHFDISDSIYEVDSTKHHFNDHKESMHSDRSDNICEANFVKLHCNKGQIIRNDTHIRCGSADICEICKNLSNEHYVDDQHNTAQPVCSDFLNNVGSLNEVNKHENFQKSVSETAKDSNQNINLHNKHRSVEIDILSECEMNSLFKTQPSELTFVAERDSTKKSVDYCRSGSSNYFISRMRADLKSVSEKDKMDMFECNHGRNSEVICGKTVLLNNDDTVLSDISFNNKCSHLTENFIQNNVVLEDSVNDETFTNNSHEELIFADSCTKNMNYVTNMNNNGQNMTRIIKKPEPQSSVIQNSRKRDKEKSNKSSFVCILKQNSLKPFEEALEGSVKAIAQHRIEHASYQICSLDKDIHQTVEQCSAARLSPSRSLIRSLSLENNAKSLKRRNHVPHHDSKAKMSNHSRWNSKEQEQHAASDICSADFRSSSSGEHIVYSGKEFFEDGKKMVRVKFPSNLWDEKPNDTQQKNVRHVHEETCDISVNRKNRRQNKRNLIGEEYYNYTSGNIDSTEGNLKKHELKVADTQSALLKTEFAGIVANASDSPVFFPRPSLGSSDREHLQTRADAKNGPTSDAIKDKSPCDETSFQGATSIPTCRGDFEDYHCSERQNTSEDFQGGNLHCTARNLRNRQELPSMHTMKPHCYDVLKVSSSIQDNSRFSVAGKRQFKNNSSCNTIAASTHDDRFSKEHDCQCHYEPKTGNQKNCNSVSATNLHSCSCRLCSSFVENDNSVWSEASDLDSECSQTMTDFPKNIPLSNSSVDSNLFNSYTFTAEENNCKSLTGEEYILQLKTNRRSTKYGSLNNGIAYTSFVAGLHCSDNCGECASVGKQHLHNISNYEQLTEKSYEENDWWGVTQPENNEKEKNKRINDQKNEYPFDHKDASKNINGKVKMLKNKVVCKSVAENSELRRNSLKQDAETEKKVYSTSHSGFSDCPTILVSRKSHACTCKVYTKDGSFGVVNGTASFKGINRGRPTCKGKLDKLKGNVYSSSKNQQSFHMDSCFNYENLNDGEHASQRKKPVSFISVDDGTSKNITNQQRENGSSSAMNHCRSYHDPAEDQNGTSMNGMYTKSKSNSLCTQDACPFKTNLMKTSETPFDGRTVKSEINNIQEPLSARLKPKKCGDLNVNFECCENSKFECWKSLTDSSNLQLGKQLLKSTDSSAPSRTSVAPSSKAIHFGRRKSCYVNECSPYGSEIERNEADACMFEQQRKRQRKLTTQENSGDFTTVQKNLYDANVKRDGKSYMLTVTQLMDDKDSDFDIDSEDMKDYYFSDEDSDTVYRNY